MKIYDSRKIAKKVDMLHSNVLKKIKRLKKDLIDFPNIRIEECTTEKRNGKYFNLDKMAFIFLIFKFQNKNENNLLKFQFDVINNIILNHDIPQQNNVHIDKLDPYAHMTEEERDIYEPNSQENIDKIEEYKKNILLAEKEKEKLKNDEEEETENEYTRPVIEESEGRKIKIVYKDAAGKAKIEALQQTLKRRDEKNETIHTFSDKRKALIKYYEKKVEEETEERLRLEKIEQENVF